MNQSEKNFKVEKFANHYIKKHSKLLKKMGERYARKLHNFANGKGNIQVGNIINRIWPNLKDILIFQFINCSKTGLRAATNLHQRIYKVFKLRRINLVNKYFPVGGYYNN